MTQRKRLMWPTEAPSSVFRWTLNVIFAAPYNFSNCIVNFLRALSAPSISQRFTFSPKRMCIANTNRKKWFQNFFSKTPFSIGRAQNKRNGLHSDAFQNFLSASDRGTRLISTGGWIAMSSLLMWSDLVPMYHCFSWFLESNHIVVLSHQGRHSADTLEQIRLSFEISWVSIMVKVLLLPLQDSQVLQPLHDQSAQLQFWDVALGLCLCKDHLQHGNRRATESELHTRSYTLETCSTFAESFHLMPFFSETNSSFTNGFKNVEMFSFFSPNQRHGRQIFALHSLGLSSITWHCMGQIWYFELLNTRIPSSTSSPDSFSLWYSSPHCISEMASGDNKSFLKLICCFDLWSQMKH